jgi:hypothetical protein
MIKKTKTPLRTVVDRGLAYFAAAHREPIEKVRERYRSNRQFRRLMNATGKQTLKGRKRQAVQFVLEELAKTRAPANPDLLLDNLWNDYRRDLKFHNLIDGLADVAMQGALHAIDTDKVPRTGPTQ